MNGKEYFDEVCDTDEIMSLRGAIEFTDDKVPSARKVISQSFDAGVKSVKKFNVYCIHPLLSCYSGTSLIAAESVEKANKIIQDFRDFDNENECDSYGYRDVDESDLQDGLFSDREGIIIQGIYYAV